MTGGNTYETCPGTGLLVTKVTQAGDSIGRGSMGGDGTGICAVCGRDVSQRAGSAKRHKATP